MNTQEFTMHHSTGTVKVKLEQEDEVFFVSINDDFLGSMEMVTNADVDFTTDDDKLQEYVEGISMYLRNDKAKMKLGEKLMERYSPNLITYQYTNDDVLELVAHPESDIEEFGNAIRDLIYDDVEFESKLSVVLSKEGSGKTFHFDIN